MSSPSASLYSKAVQLQMKTGRGSHVFQVIQKKVGARRTSCFIQCSLDLGPLCPWPSGGAEQGKLRHSLTPVVFFVTGAV